MQCSSVGCNVEVSNFVQLKYILEKFGAIQQGFVI
uniref:Uncharacterized protein n=1 Tax=Picea sitchensis TaxID=3332 RepID=C0PTT2_PICSI|nr:unknown [Picea sitchensis]